MTALALTPAELAAVRRFGMDRPEATTAALIAAVREYERRGVEGIPIPEGEDVFALMASLADALAAATAAPSDTDLEASADLVAAARRLKKYHDDGFIRSELRGDMYVVLDAILAPRIPEPADTGLRQKLLKTLRDTRCIATPRLEQGYAKPIPEEAERMADAILPLFSRTPQPVPSENEFSEQVLVERRRQVAKGYTAEHDEKYGADHLLMWAHEYARRGETVESVALVEAARELLLRLRLARAPQPSKVTDAGKTREQALAEYEAGIRSTGTEVPNAFLAGFSRGWDACDDARLTPAQPEQVMTVEDLDALPVESVVRVIDAGVPCAAIKSATDIGDRWWVTGFYSGDGYPSYALHDLYAGGGITVLYRPATTTEGATK